MNLQQPACSHLFSYIQVFTFLVGQCVCCHKSHIYVKIQWFRWRYFTTLIQMQMFWLVQMFWVNLRLYCSWLKTKLVTRLQDFQHIAAETVCWLCLSEESSCMRYFCLIKWSFMQISINQSWLCNTAHQLLLWTGRHMEQITLKSKRRLSFTLVLSSVFLIHACI